MTRARQIGLFLAIFPTSLSAGAPDFVLPIDCTLGDTCFIQQYADHDPGPGATDFACGTLSYDDHSGTDFAVPTVRAARSGVVVRAAADGRVTATRDGEADHFNDSADTGTDGRDCGNGVVIDHGEGWQTQYCHLRQGSVRLAPGDHVRAGDPLGLVGMSGRAAFPHLHFSVRLDDQAVDPFAPDAAKACGQSGRQMWWDHIAYVPGALVGVGFTDAVPEYSDITVGLPNRAALPVDSPALVLWAHLFGARAGDTLRLLISGPDGVFSDQAIPLQRDQARLFRASGRKLHPGNRVPGPYRGTAILIRDGQEISRLSVATRLSP